MAGAVAVLEGVMLLNDVLGVLAELNLRATKLNRVIEAAQRGDGTIPQAEWDLLKAETDNAMSELSAAIAKARAEP